MVRRVVALKRAEKGPADVDAAPVVKWAGGKSKLLPELIKRAPTKYRRYFEPFVGGAALFFHLCPKDAVLNDFNADLVNMYRCVAWNVEAVIRRLAGHKRRHTDEHFYKIRDRFNGAGRKMSDVDRAAAFLYMNKTCYNGLYRVNAKGRFNVPVGRYSEPQIYRPALLRASGERLRRAELRTGQFDDAAMLAEKGDFVYFDPPYHPVSATSNFTSYTTSDFDEDAQRHLADIARHLVKRGAHVLLSNSDTPFIRKLYRKDFKVDRVLCNRAINSKAKSRGPVGELIIRGK